MVVGDFGSPRRDGGEMEVKSLIKVCFRRDLHEG